MTRPRRLGSLATCLCIGLAAPAFAAPPAADSCLGDVRAFNARMQTEGYWLGGSAYDFGYPMVGYGYGYGYPMTDNPTVAAGVTYQNARPGYEVRTLVVAATILARNGQQAPCETVLATASGIYTTYVADLHPNSMMRADSPGWRQKEIAAALPVTAQTTSFRSDQLLGAEVRNPQDDPLGSVNDLVLNPRTGKIAYLVVGRGGLFGIGEDYVPVPWSDFKVAEGGGMLVLDATKASMTGAPEVKEDRFTSADHFDQESQKVDDYWAAHLGAKATN